MPWAPGLGLKRFTPAFTRRSQRFRNSVVKKYKPPLAAHGRENARRLLLLPQGLQQPAFLRQVVSAQSQNARLDPKFLYIRGLHACFNEAAAIRGGIQPIAG